VDSGSGLATENKSLWAVVSCIDFTVNHEPTDRMRHFTLEWRSEFYFLNREVLAPDGSGRDMVNAWGFTTVLHAKLSRTWEAGAQGGLWEPDFRPWEGASGVSFAPHTTAARNAYRCHGALYVTWWQSPFVRIHLQYDAYAGHNSGQAQHQVTLQVVFAAGPHKHERY